MDCSAITDSTGARHMTHINPHLLVYTSSCFPMVPECLQVMHYCACAQMWPHCLFFISCPVGLCHCDVDLLNHIEKIGILAKKSIFIFCTFIIQIKIT